LAHPNHDTLVARASHNAGEDGAGGVVAGKARLDHTRPIVTDQGRNLTLLVGRILLQVIVYSRAFHYLHCPTLSAPSVLTQFTLVQHLGSYWTAQQAMKHTAGNFPLTLRDMITVVPLVLCEG